MIVVGVLIGEVTVLAVQLITKTIVYWTQRIDSVILEVVINSIAVLSQAYFAFSIGG